MTIFTSKTPEKANEITKAKAAGYVIAGTEETGDARPAGSAVSASNIDYMIVDRRRRLMGGLCLSLLAIWLFLAAVLAGLVAYRYFHRQRVHGWCGTSYYDDMYGQHAGSDYHHRPRTARLLQEEVDIDMENDVEKIMVPKFGVNRPATFIHDFREDLTAIVDELGHQCFVKRLDRESVSPPKNFVDLLEKMQSGYYGRDAKVVHEEYRVGERLTPLAVEQLGSGLILSHCANKATYELRKVSSAIERKDAIVEKARRRRGWFLVDLLGLWNHFDEF